MVLLQLSLVKYIILVGNPPHPAAEVISMQAHYSAKEVISMQAPPSSEGNNYYAGFGKC